MSKPIKAITYVRISKEGVEDLPQVGEKKVPHYVSLLCRSLLGCTVDTSTVHKSKTHYFYVFMHAITSTYFEKISLSNEYKISPALRWYMIFIQQRVVCFHVCQISPQSESHYIRYT